MESLDEVVRASCATAVLAPLGLFHSDHLLTHRAALLLRHRHPRLSWFLYAEALYRRIAGLTDARLAECAGAGLTLHRTEFPINPWSAHRKHAAVRCYRSQLRALSTAGRPGYADAATEEVFWQIAA